jgi:hypothetical protein
MPLAGFARSDERVRITLANSLHETATVEPMERPEPLIAVALVRHETYATFLWCPPPRVALTRFITRIYSAFLSPFAKNAPQGTFGLLELTVDVIVGGHANHIVWWHVAEEAVAVCGPLQCLAWPQRNPGLRASRRHISSQQEGAVALEDDRNGGDEYYDRRVVLDSYAHEMLDTRDGRHPLRGID